MQGYGKEVIVGGVPHEFLHRLMDYGGIQGGLIYEK